MKHVLSILFFFICTSIFAQDLYTFSRKSAGRYQIHKINPDNCTFNVVQEFSQSFTDIALHPNSKMYACRTNGDIYELNLNNGTMNLVGDAGSIGFVTAMTVGADGTFYLAESDGILYTFNLQTKNYIKKGATNYISSGDLSFRNGQLYLGSEEYIIKVDIENPGNSTPATAKSWFNPTSGIWGIMTDFIDCDTQYTYALTGGSPTSNFYQIDIENQTSTLLCNLPLRVYGATTADEYRASSSIDVEYTVTDATCTAQGEIDLTILSGEELTFTIAGVVTETTNTIIPIDAGTYDILIKDKYDCEKTIENVVVDAESEVEITASGEDANCSTGQGKLNLTVVEGNDVEFTITNTATGVVTTTTATSIELEAGEYRVVGKEDTCESEEQLVTIEPFVLEEINVDIMTQSGNCEQSGAILFQNPQGNYTYTVSSIGDTTNDSIEVPDGTYTIIVNDGCQTKNYDNIVVETVCEQDKIITVPSVFAPNGNGANEWFKVLTTEELLIVDYRIYNRWGELVYEAANFPSSNYEMYWNGQQGGTTYNGEFTYYIQCKKADDTIIELQGISLVLQ